VADDGTGANHDGVAEEGDDARSDLENVDGGSGSDRTRGNGRANRLRGRGGSDRLNGLGGSDSVSGGGGSDRIRRAGDGAVDGITCGSGYDVAIGDWNDKVDSDCERVRRR
jgi:Ca2+-binding RTX toxin-like protein